MGFKNLLSFVLIGVVASSRSMAPMALLGAARYVGRHSPGRLLLLEHPLSRPGAMVMGQANCWETR